ncbi:MAG: prolyl oligopeptidase family serine peptidase [Chitinophagaceae bacterium]|nr:prolyl oligopeptidase family serine peptidase [Chitinophagaceae bacterium]
MNRIAISRKKIFYFFGRLKILAAIFFVCCGELAAQSPPTYPVTKIAEDFRDLLRRPVVDFNASFQPIPTDSVLTEKGFIYTEANEKIPILIYKPVNAGSARLPVVICLHGTGGTKEQMSGVLYRLTTLGIMAVAIDARYHGERIPGGAHGSKEYVDAIANAWQNTDPETQQYPFFFDTVYDLWRLTDYLITRADVQSNRIGMMGISMGGIETWMAASVDKRIKVAVPIIAAQSFKWSLENNKWQGRARTIWAAHEHMAKSTGDSGVTAKNVATFWNKLLPEITGRFDCPSMIRLFAPRPLLLLNNEKDGNCPLPGAQLVFEAATQTYRSMLASDKLKIHITPNEPHRFTPEHLELMMDWFSKWL